MIQQQSTKNVRVEYKYSAISDSSLSCTVKNLFNRLAASVSLLYLLHFSRLIRNAHKIKQVTNNLYSFWCVVLLSIFTRCLYFDSL